MSIWAQLFKAFSVKEFMTSTTLKIKCLILFFFSENMLEAFALQATHIFSANKAMLPYNMFNTRLSLQLMMS